MAAKGSWTKALFTGLWTVLNFARKLVFNLIFLVLVIGVIIAISSSEDPVNSARITNNKFVMLI